MMRKFQRTISDITNILNTSGQFLLFGPKLVLIVFFNIIRYSVNIARYFVWPKQSRRRYRTALLAVFLFAFLAFNLDYPRYWNKSAEWLNPKLDSIDMPESIVKFDKWGVFKALDDTLTMPHFWDLPFSQGLDLQGGIHLIYSADLSGVPSGEYKESMNGLRDVIERRVNLFGVREPRVIVEGSSLTGLIINDVYFLPKQGLSLLFVRGCPWQNLYLVNFAGEADFTI